MTGEELDDWMEFYQMEPFGNEEKMSDKRNSLLCHVSSMGGEHTPSDFEMYQDENTQKIKVEEMTEEQKKNVQKAIFQMLITK